ncbi:MAG: transposase [Desulfofustis sp.]|nr:transposase [Desulfofustis sp.]
MKRQRRKHTPEFKARIALEAIKGVKTVSQIAKEFEVHPVMVSAWKKDMLDHLPEVFEKKNTRKDKHVEQETEKLQHKVGQLTMG